MKEYNLFTQKLFEQGYTFEHYPNYAKMPNPVCDRKLFDIMGGFRYENWYQNQKVYSTGCGLLCRGSDFSNGSVSYMGIDWKPENNNPVIPCPYKKEHCTLRSPLLDHIEGGGICKISQCDCHEVYVPYDYEYSRDRVRDERHRRIRENYEELKRQKKGHVCYWQTSYNEWTEQWEQRYDPVECARMCLNIGGICDLKHTPISKKRGNVFYDVKITRIRRDGTLFDGQKEITIQKGCRLLETGKSMTICENIVRYGRKQIISHEQMKYHSEIFIYGWNVEVLNIRDEYRESRDLLQDLQDIREGITIVHASDQEKRNKELKRQNRVKQKEKREKRLEQKIVKNGWDSLEPFSLDYHHALKWFGQEKIKALEKRHQKYVEEERNKLRQMSLFEFM